MKTLKKWIVNHKLDCEVREGIIEFPASRMIYVEPVGGRIVGLVDYVEDENIKQAFGLLVPDHIKHEAQELNASHYVFQFGSKFFYTPVDKVIDLELVPFKYVGKAHSDLKNAWPFLGIHGRYELMNGTRDYSDWCKKANFLNIKTLGLCEKHTLAGTLPFQKACDSAGIKSVIGGSYTVERENGQKYIVKLYVKNIKGWRNLLNINKIVGIDNDGYCIEEGSLVKRAEGLICVMVPGEYSIQEVAEVLQGSFKELFFQIDTVEFEVDDRDKEYLEILKSYFASEIKNVPPVLINDAYYLEKEDQPIKEILNNAGNVKGEEVALNQYFKNLDDNFFALEDLFSEEDERLIPIFKKAMKSAEKIADLCDFKIDTSSMHLPEYKMSKAENKRWKGDLKKMFFDLIDEEFEKLDFTDKEYSGDDAWSRVEKEAKVIIKGGYISYFLILWDICKWCKENDILTGIGRGSSGGSLIAYLLGIIKINPLDYELLFERFLNEGRTRQKTQEEILLIETDEGKIELKPNQSVVIQREGVEKEITAKEIEKEDLILKY